MAPKFKNASYEFFTRRGFGETQNSRKNQSIPPRIRLARRRWHTLPPPFLGRSSAFKASRVIL